MSDTHFNIKIAGKVIEIYSLYDCVHEYCLDYLTDERSEFSIRITHGDITAERTREEKSDSGGRIPEDYPDSYLEVLAVYRKITEELLKYDILLMHGSAIGIDGKGILFIAPSGTGKSTHAQVWKRVFGYDVILINDDKPLVRFTGDNILVCGTPWSGKKGLNTNVNMPLRAIYKLNRSDSYSLSDPDVNVIFRDGVNAVCTLNRDEKWQALCSQCYRSENPVNLSKSLSLIDRMIGEIPIYDLVCDMSDTAAKVAYYGLSNIHDM